MLRRLSRSLRLRLLLALLVPLGAISAVGALLDYNTALELTGDAFDKSLANTAIGLAARVETDRDGDLAEHLVANEKAVIRITSDLDLKYLVLDANGKLISGDPRLTPLIRPIAQTLTPNFGNAVLGGETLRTVTYLYEGPEGRATIVVADPLSRRAASARSILVVMTFTNLAMTFAVIVVAVFAIGFALKPLKALSVRVGEHDVDRLRPISLRGVPIETRPLVRAINRLMSRVRNTVLQRQAFVNNTAHQLRTPLAGLQAQVGLLAGEPMSKACGERVARIEQSIQRLSHLAHQMLALARASEEPAAAHGFEFVSLPSLLEDAASSCIDLAVSRGVDLGFEAHVASARGSHWMLREMLLNLVTNAIVHTQRGTEVTVRCGSGRPAADFDVGGPFLEVEDNGPGISASDRERVFERYVRLGGERDGTGLGLTIVKETAQRHAARVTVSEGRGGSGTRIRVVFPVQSQLS